jgi:hypothetical protein
LNKPTNTKPNYEKRNMSPSAHLSNDIKMRSYKEMYNSVNKNQKRQNTENKLRNRTIDTKFNLQHEESSAKSERSLSSSRNRNHSDKRIGTGNSIFGANSNSYFKTALNEWKDRHFKLQKDNDYLRSTLITEKKNLALCQKKLKTYDKKINSFEELNKKLNKIVIDHENLLNQYEQSELIRREQAKLIKSLQNEVDVLRRYTKLSDEESNSKGEQICDRNLTVEDTTGISKKLKKKTKTKTKIKSQVIEEPSKKIPK